MLGDQALGDAEQVDLGVVGVAHRRTGEDLRGAGYVGERVGEQAAGAGLGESHGALHAAQLLDDERGEAGVAGADEVMADGVADLAGDLTEFLGAETAAGGRNARVDHAGVRAERKHHAWLEERTDDRFERHGAYPEGTDLHVGLALAGATDVAQTRHDLLFEHRPEFERRTRQHHEGLAVAMIEDARRGAARIGQGLGADRDEALAEVRFGKSAADQLEALAQRLLGGRHMFELKSERGGDGCAGVVVGGRTDAAGGDDQIISTPSFADLAGDFLGIIADDNGTGDRQAAAGEVLAQPEEMAVLADTVQQLVAHVNDEDLTGSAVAGKHLRKRGT